MTQRDQDDAIAQVGHRTMRPHPHGLAGRIADAHDDGDEALAKALTDAALCEDEGLSGTGHTYGAVVARLRGNRAACLTAL